MNKILSDYYAIRETHDKALGVLEQEALRIVNVLKKVFKKKSPWWSFKYYEGDTSPLPCRIYDDYFHIYVSESLDSGVRDYAQGFPVSFFDMSDAEIESYLKNEIEVQKQKELLELQAAQLKIVNQKTKQAAIKSAAISKLTAEERKVLGV